MPREITSGSSFWARLRGDALSGDGSGNDASNPLAFEQFNRDIGPLDVAAATTDTANTGLISLVKRITLRVSNIYKVLCTGTYSGNEADNAIVSGTITSPGAGKYVFVKSYSFSFSADPSAARTLTIASGGGNIVNVDVITGGPGPVPVGVGAAVDTTVTYSLAASGTAGNFGKLRVYYVVLDAV